MAKLSVRTKLSELTIQSIIIKSSIFKIHSETKKSTILFITLFSYLILSVYYLLKWTLWQLNKTPFFLFTRELDRRVLLVSIIDSVTDWETNFYPYFEFIYPINLSLINSMTVNCCGLWLFVFNWPSRVPLYIQS